VLARGQPGKRTVAQEVGGCGGQKVVLDEMVVELSELSGLPNALSAVAAACLPLEAPAPAACFGLGCLTFGRRLLFLLENTVLGSTRQPLSSLCIAPSAFPLCSLHVTHQATLRTHHLCDYHHYNPTTISPVVHAAVLSLHRTIMSPNQSNVASGTHGSLTLTASQAGPTTLRLRAEAEPSEGRRIQWAEDVIDNEGMGKKSSKGMFPFNVVSIFTDTRQ